MSPVACFITPFLARKGDGGMVEAAAEHRREPRGLEALRRAVPAPARSRTRRVLAASTPAAYHRATATCRRKGVIQ